MNNQVFKNIDLLYENHSFELLVDDALRPCKSVTRDVEATVAKFCGYIKTHEKYYLSHSEELEALGLTDINDTFNTNIKTMKELKLLEKDGRTVSVACKHMIENNISPGLYILDLLYSINSLSDISMYLNSLLCTLREGYLTGTIRSFPDSNEKFKRYVPDAVKRNEFRQLVFDIYGFCGRYRTIDDSYTPNANYRILTELRNLNLIADKRSYENVNIPEYELTNNAFHLLKTINENLGFGPITELEPVSESDERENSETITQKRGENKLFYGTPGCGKSHKVMEEWEPKGKDYYERTTFYPDYTNSDFIGQVMPGLDGNGDPTYEFVEGPFTKVLIKAFNNPGKDVALIIEELNRGNAAAIFGEIFQLLDRREDGRSRYEIYNPNIIKELNKEVKNKPDGEDFTNVYIPSNMSIIATMNTSDQNVYPLDTAFQRRWSFEKIRNSFLKEGIEETPENLDKADSYVSQHAYELAKMFIPGTSKTWEEFVGELNEEIVRSKDAAISSEDKQIGIYFLDKNELSENKNEAEEKKVKAFSEKMLKYIWEDIAKIDPSEWFESCNSLDDVFDHYKKDHLAVLKKIH